MFNVVAVGVIVTEPVPVNPLKGRSTPTLVRTKDSPPDELAVFTSPPPPPPPALKKKPF